jgi:hypothetical protein
MSIRNMMWTALPNGFTAAGDKLVLSVYLSPRLVTDNGVDGTLQQFFPELQDWPATVGPLQFKVQVQSGPAFTVARASTVPLESPLWTALFNKGTFVRSYKFDERLTQNIRSYPVRKVLTFLKSAYQAVAVQTPDKPPTRGELNFEDSPRTITDLVPIALVLPEIERRTAAEIEAELLDGHAVPAAFGTPATDFYQVRTFHQFLSRRNPDGTPAPLAEQTLPKLDFHDVVSRLSQYPELLRRLGLVVDLELPTTIPATGNIQVIPQLSGPPPMSPWTAYQVDAARRRFQPAAGTEVADGMLQLGSGNYDAVEVDVDGAAHKMLDFAFNLGRLDHVKRTPGSAQRFGFPSLRSAGFAATRQGRATQLHGRFGTAHAQNGAIVANPQNGPVLAADDLVRGYRIDVWDSLTSKWHSLCRRDGTYDFENGALMRHLDPDEGSTALATSQSADGTSQDLYLPESLFRWAGWSLTVPRIGKTVGPQDTAAALENPAQTEFKLVVSFKPVVTPNDSRLPRLRFGANYQFRARAVDLAGNSLPPDASIPAGFSIPPQPVPYLRYEPVAAPVVVLRAALSPTTTPGESVERIVIRSNFNTPAAAPSERHLAPAKVSQEMAEVHGMFDTATGLDKTVYTTLTQKDGDLGVDPAHPDQPVPHPEAQLVLPYLPDPLAAGAAFVNLPGVAPGAVFTVPFTVTWPNERPFRIVLAEGAGAPVLTETAQERFLTVRIEKAEEVTVQLSCYPTRRAVEVGDLGLDPGSQPAQSSGPAATGRERRALDADAAAFPDLGARGAAAAHRAAIPESSRLARAWRNQGAANRRHSAERQEHEQARHQRKLGRNYRRRRSRPATKDASWADARIRDPGRPRRDDTEDRRRPRVSRHQISQRRLRRHGDVALPRVFCRQPDAAGQRFHAGLNPGDARHPQHGAPGGAQGAVCPADLRLVQQDRRDVEFQRARWRAQGLSRSALVLLGRGRAIGRRAVGLRAAAARRLRSVHRPRFPVGRRDAVGYGPDLGRAAAAVASRAAAAAFPQRGRHCQWAHAGMAAGRGRRADLGGGTLRRLRRRSATLVLRYRARSRRGLFPLHPPGAGALPAEVAA